MKIAAIDIGTNAIKSKIFDTTPTSIEFIESIRTPMRLGDDVYTQGILSEVSLETLTKIIKRYQKYFADNEIQIYEIVATSAFRDAGNSENARRFVEQKINHPLKIISGLEEAKLISFNPITEQNKKTLLIDHGGGSTDCLFVDSKEMLIQSFNLGAVRSLYKQDNGEELKRLKEWIGKLKKIKTLIGIGGNIKDFFRAFGQSSIKPGEFNDFSMHLKALSAEEKIKNYHFSKDRADVIDNAMMIFSDVISQASGLKNIKCTKWGVSDSIAVKLFHETYSRDIKINI